MPSPHLPSLSGKTLLITGGSRGIGLAIARRAAGLGANIALLAKTTEPHPTLPGTIYTAAQEIEAMGGRALPIACDIRDDLAVEQAVAQTVDTFGGIDFCVNNASAISLSDTQNTPPKRFDLMFGINTRGTYSVTRACLPHLMKAENPHVLMLSPPLDLQPKWFAGHVAYSIAKYGMSLCVLGFAEEFAKYGIGVNALWPRTIIATSAIRAMIGGDAMMRAARSPEILAECAVRIFMKPAQLFSGQFLLDDSFLVQEGVSAAQIDSYRMDPSCDLIPDFFVPEYPAAPVSLKKIIGSS